MGRKKRKDEDKDKNKAYCWHCDRHFESYLVLVQHKKAKHFKCPRCNKRLTSGEGFISHLWQVHRETISQIPNSKPGRETVQENEEVLSDDDEPAAKKPRLDGVPPPVAQMSYAAPSAYNPYMPPNPYMASSMPPPFAPPSYPHAPPPGYPGPPPPFPYAPGYLPPPHGYPPPGMPPSTAAPVAPVAPYSAQSAGSEYNPNAATPPPLFPNAESEPQPAPPTEPGTTLIYPEMEFSPEEKRAMLDRYSFDRVKLKEKASQLSQSIESRLAAIAQEPH